MRFSIIVPLLVGGIGTLASPTGHLKSLRVSWTSNKETDKSRIDVVSLADASKSSIASACGNTLDSGSFLDFPIVFNVDKDGHGNLTAGSTNYLVHSKPEVSGGITCTRIWDQKSARVTCDVPYSGSHTELTGDNVDNCGVETLLSNMPPDVDTTTSHRNSSNLDRRYCDTIKSTHLIGDGNPHQDYYHEQVSENQFCGAAASCSVSHNEGTSITFSATIGLAYEFITGNFGVSYSYTETNTYTCNAGSGDTVCVWYNMAHTAYTTHTLAETCGSIQDQMDSVVIRAPNNNNVGGGFYCVTGGACRSNGQGYWEDGRAGGP